MSRSVDALFRSFTFNGLTLPNRIVMAPMTRSMSPGGVPGENVAAYYRRRAENECGLIITEGTTVEDPVAPLGFNEPHFHGKAALAGWKRVVDEVHEGGGRIVPQLWHTGMARVAANAPNPELPSAGPSGLAMPGNRIAEPMSKQHIQLVVDAFAKAARSAQELGFDGIEIHGAHGYIIDQFFWSGLNERSDEYGGDLVSRTRFAVDIVTAIRREVGNNYPLILRFSQWKQQDFTAKLAHTPDELGKFLKPLVEAGVDMFHCSQRRFWEPEFDGSDLNVAGWTKKLSGKPTITVGSVGLSGEFLANFAGEVSEVVKLDGLLDRLEKDEFDLVAVGRALLGDPFWIKKIREGKHDKLQAFTKERLAELI